MMRDLNEPITLDDEYLFCPAGNILARAFLNASREAVARVHEEDDAKLSEDLGAALFMLKLHTASCPDCNED